jgi:hypothetical protein
LLLKNRYFTGLGLLLRVAEVGRCKTNATQALVLNAHMANLLNMTHVTAIFDVWSVRDVIDLLFRANQSSFAAGFAAPGAAADVIAPGL